MLSLLLVGACANQSPREVPVGESLANLGFTLGPQVRHINNFQINGWSSMDRRNAIIYVRASRNYLVTLRNPCNGLQETERLGYSTTAGSLTDKDKLLVRRDSGRMESCFIDTIYELEKAKRP